MDTLAFLSQIFKHSEHNIYLWSAKKTYNFAVNQLEQMAAQAIKLSSGGQDVYFGVCPSKKLLGNYERPKINEISGIGVLWADIDIADTAHAAPNLPPDVSSAINILPGILPPSIIVHSGHGLHAYWLLDENWALDSDDERQEAAALVKKLQANIRQNAAQYGWHLDSVADLTRVLRVPGTLNYKDKTNPKICQVIEWSDGCYSVSDFDELADIIESKPIDTTVRNERFKRLPTDGPAEYMTANCAFIQHCEVNAVKLSYAEWLAMITNVVRAVDGVQAVHQLSALDKKRYNQQVTDQKIDEVCANIANPQGCQYIQSALGFTGCPDGGCGVNAPCGWSLSHTAQAKAILRKITIPTADNVFNDKVLGALSLLEQKDKTEFVKFKDKCRGNLNLNDLSKVLKEHRLKNSQLDITDSDSTGGSLQAGQKLGDVTTCQYVEDTPLNLAIPAGFVYGKNGVGIIKKQGDVTVYYTAAGAPVIISERIYNMDTRREKVKLVFKYFGQWTEIIRKRSEVFSAKNIIGLTDYGLSMSSESAKYLVKYLQELETVNPQIPLKYAVSKIGWRDYSMTDFVIPNVSDYRIDLEDEGEITEAFSVCGSFDEWKKTANQIRQMPFARFILAAAFSAPLLKIFQNRNFMIFFWGTSGGGKTASQVFGLSVWGSPNKLMKSFYGTQNGIEKALAFSNDFPMVINEKQVMNGRDKQELFEQIVYMLEGGRGKLRASKDGLQKTATWRSIGMASGEEPLSKENSIQGVKTRLLELNVYPVIPDDDIAKSLYTLSERHHGYAGSIFIKTLVERESGDNYARIELARQALVKVLKDTYPNHFSVHIDNVALVAMGDYLSSQYIFGIPQKQAEQEAYSLVCTIMDELPTERQISDVERGWDFVQNWLAANDGRFERPHADIKITPVYGFKKDDYTCIYPEYLTKALTDAGFSPDKLMREFANKGRIATETDGGKRRFKVQMKYNGRKTRVIKINEILQEHLL